jgi:hypothetical protein
LLKQLVRVPVVLVALFLQFVAVLGVMFITHIFALKLSPIAFACSSGVFAASFSYIAKLDRWWWFIQFLFLPALVALFALNIHPNFFLAAFFITLLVFWNTFRTQVPLYLSSEKVWRALENFLPQPKRGMVFSFVDIGSGLGGVLAHLANSRPDGNYYGIESAPLPFLWSWLRFRWGGYRQCQVYWGDLWNCDLSHYDVVFAYLSPAPMERLWRKAQAEMRSGTVFISSTFAVPGQVPVEVVSINDLHQSTLLVWRM